MDGIMALTIICVVLGVGEYVSAKSKAVISLMFVAAVIFFVGFQLGIFPTGIVPPGADPTKVTKNLFVLAELTGIGGVTVAFLITHMGTLMNLRELQAQWRTVLIAGSAVACAALLFVFVAPLVMDRNYAIAAAAPMTGGIVAALIMGEAATKLGHQDIAIFAMLLVIFHSFIGFPIASVFLKREAKRLKFDFATSKPSLEQVKKEDVPVKKKLIPPLPKEFQNSTYILLAKLGLVVVLGVQLSILINNVIFSAFGIHDLIHKFVVCLILGVIAREIGFLEENILTKANVNGFAMIALMGIVFSSFASASMPMLIKLAVPMLLCFAIGVAGIIIGSYVVGKLLKVNTDIAIAIGVTALFGFPGTFIVSNEVANSVGETDEERKFILDNILPKMLIAGFITVTIASVIIAGVLVKFMS